jgi:hypothetical protein
MKWTTIATALAAVPLASAAGYSKEQYRSGEVMEKMMMAKEVLQMASLALSDRSLTKYRVLGLSSALLVLTTRRSGKTSTRSALTRTRSSASTVV